MNRSLIRLAAAGLGLAALPAQAQTATPAPDATPAPVDPANLAAAQAVVAQIFPQGIYARMLDGSLSGLLDQLYDSMGAVPLRELASASGKSPQDLLRMGKATMNDIATIYDPAYKQRMHLISEAMQPVLIQQVSQIEPDIRAGLAQAYARRFTPTQLHDMAAFFATPSGSAYAANAMLLQMDPAVMDRMKAAMPMMMQGLVQQLPAIMDQVKARSVNLPKPRKWADLPAADRKRLSQLLGVSEADLARQAAAAPAAR